jgi:DNA-binding NarL/FixJ family response regulator
MGLSLPDSSVRETERSEAGWIELLETAQYDYWQATRDRRRLMREAAQHGFSRRKIAAAMGLSVSTVQQLVGRISTTGGD